MRSMRRNDHKKGRTPNKFMIKGIAHLKYIGHSNDQNKNLNITPDLRAGISYSICKKVRLFFPCKNCKQPIKQGEKYSVVNMSYRDGTGRYIRRLEYFHVICNGGSA